MKTRNFLLLSLLFWPFCFAGAQSAAFSSDAPRCLGDSVHFTPALPGGTILSETWDFGDGTSVTIVPPSPLPASPAHRYPVAGYYMAVRTVTFTSGTVSTSQPVQIWPLPVAEFMWSSTGCVQDTVRFVDFSFTPAWGIIVSREWNFGEPGGGNGTQSTAYNPLYHYQSAGSYPVRLVVHTNSGCTDTAVHTVTIGGSAPAADSLAVTSMNLAGDTCLAASGLITLSGDGSACVVQPGGHADLVAGGRIRMMPQTRVVAGGYLLGRIASNCNYCSGYKEGYLTTEPEPLTAGTAQSYRIWPNPASDRIFITPPLNGDPFIATLYRLDGQPVCLLKGNPSSTQSIDVASLPLGLYILGISDREGCRFHKIVKQ